MRVLFLATWFPHPMDNGSKVRAHYLLRALAARHEVTLMSFSFGTADVAGAVALRGLCSEIHTVNRDPFRRSTWEGRLRYLSLSPIVSRPVPEMAAAVRRILSEHSFDLTISSTGVAAAYALMDTGSRARILEEHNCMSRLAWDRCQAQDTVLGRLRCWVSWNKSRIHERRLFRRFDLCTMVSEQDRQYCRQALRYDGPLEVVPNGVDCEHNRPGPQPPIADSLVFNGSLTYEANRESMRFFLADVFPRIRAQIPAAHLTITGSVDGVDLAGLRLDDHVRLTGLVDDIRPYVAGAWACVTPIRQGGGTRLKVLEAMALGTPVVATSKAVEGHGLIAEEHFLLADSAEDFARQTVRLLTNPELRARLSSSARQMVEAKYDWRRIGNRFADWCEETVDRKVSPS